MKTVKQLDKDQQQPLEACRAEQDERKRRYVRDKRIEVAARSTPA